MTNWIAELRPSQPTTTTDLIPIHNNPEGKQTVNARDLHSFLESKQEFANWIKDRIEKYKFKEYLDFVVFDNLVKNPLGGRPRVEYHLSIDMAKELSMVECNDKGQDARQYFLKCEKIAKGAIAPKGSLVEQAQMFLEMAQRQERLEAQQALTDQKVKNLELNAKTETEYFTVSAWASLINLKLPEDLAKRLGKAAAGLSRARGIPMGTAKHIRYGKVNTYHESVLEAIMGVGDEEI